MMRLLPIHVLRFPTVLLAMLFVASCASQPPNVVSDLPRVQQAFAQKIQAIDPGALGQELVEDHTRETFLYPDAEVVPTVVASVETVPVTSTDDAADDPAIWIHPTHPLKSLILATDKKAGVGVYDLAGQQVQFVLAGLPNNIDVRQGLSVGYWQGDLALTSNRADNTVTVFSVDATGAKIIGGFPVDVEPYGICMGILSGKPYGFVTYKNGRIEAYRFDAIAPEVIVSSAGVLDLETQLEGCVHHDQSNTLFIGEEEAGIWRLDTVATLNVFSTPASVDAIGAPTGLVADVEGLAFYVKDDLEYLIASSQGNDSYAVYDGRAPYAFRGRFRITTGDGIDGVQETDGLEVSGAAFGRVFPHGFLVVQDGFNAPFGDSQNFKVIDWREIEAVLGLP
ncbi:MAG: 3-phytase [Planctomycetaceae bacterium]|jgi:3-phytase